MDMLPVGYLYFQPGRQRVNNRGAYPMQAAGHLVSGTAKFAAGVQDGINHRHRWNSHFGMDSNRNTTPVIGYADDVVF